MHPATTTTRISANQSAPVNPIFFGRGGAPPVGRLVRLVAEGTRTTGSAACSRWSKAFSSSVDPPMINPSTYSRPSGRRPAGWACMGRVTEKQATKKKKIWRVVQIAFSVVLVAAIFLYAIPKLADYSSVWDTIRQMTNLEIASLIAATIFNLFTYWWQNMASLPGLRLWPAA